MQDNINNIVSRVLNSPELRTSLSQVLRQENLGCLPNNVSTSSILPSASSSSTRDELHRLFPSIRGISSTSGSTNNNNTREEPPIQFSSIRGISTPTRKCRLKNRSRRSFSKDIILLRSPDAVLTLRGVKKSYAFETGFALSNVEFYTDWNQNDVMSNIGDLFKEHLRGKAFELMQPISGRLIRPSLPPGKTLDARTIKSVFYQKIVYLRPFEEIGNTNDSLSCDDSDTEMNCLEDQLAPTSPSSPPETGDSESVTAGHINDMAEELLESDVQNAIENSLKPVEHNSVGEILQGIKDNINEENISQFNIYRDDIFKCCIRAIRRKTFNPFNRISVKFSDIEDKAEGAVDRGGPTREMFRLVMDHIKNGKLFFGDEKKYICLNREAIENNEYFEAGRLIALSLIHGGPGPQFFSETLYSALVFGFSNSVATFNDVDQDIKESITKIETITDINVLQEHIADEPFFSIAGCQFIKDIEEKDKLIKDVLEFYAFHRVRPALKQFKEGLKTGNILGLMKLHPVILKDLFCGNKQPITANLLENLFAVDFSEMGSSKRSVENRIISFWRDFVIDCEENESELTTEDILVFCTGASSIPPLGFDFTPSIMFLHDEDSLYPRANTCGLQLHLPTIHKTYENFKKNMCFAMGNCKDFAFA